MGECKHDERFLMWEDHSKPIRCAVCEIERLRAEAEADAQLHRREIEKHNQRFAAVPTLDFPPKTPEEGLRFLADWFDAMYPDDLDTQVQDDCRRWAREIERLRALLLRWVRDADSGELDGVDLSLMAESEQAARAAVGGGE